MTKLVRNPLVHLAIIALVTCLAYANSFRVPFIFDDHTIIEENSFIQDARFLANPSLAKGSYLYYPLKLRYVSLLSFAIDYQRSGLDPRDYHQTNLIIHLLNAFLVYGLILLTFATPRLASSRLLGYDTWVAGCASLLFALHPVQTQAVTYIVQRYMSLAALFYLLSLYLYAKWRLASLEVRRTGARGLGGILTALYLFALLAALLGLRTKEVCLTLPLALVLYEFLFFEGTWWKRLLLILPFGLATFIVPLGLLDLVDLNQPLAAILHNISRRSFIATPVTSGDYLLTQFVVWVTYLRLLVLPVHQNLDYDFPIYRSVFDPAVILSLLLLAALLGLVVWLVQHYRKREPAVRLVAFGAGLFFLGPLVESSFMPMIDVINEHRLYLAAAGFFTALAVGVIWGAVNRAGRRPYLPGVAALVLLALAGTYGVATYCRNQVYQSEISLWEDVVKKSPRKARPYNELGLAYARKGRYSEALPFYQKAAALDPRFANYYNNMGQAYLNLGDLAKAQEMFNLALKKEPENYFAINNLGVIYLRQQRLQEAKEMFDRALRISPGYTVAQHNLQIIQRMTARKP